METITRLGFCPLCARRQQPKLGNYFLAFGSTSQKFKMIRVRRTTYEFGYVPHIYQLGEILGDKCRVYKSCSMNGCGVEITTDEKGDVYYSVKKLTPEVWDVSSWNALLELKHNSFTRTYEV